MSDINAINYEPLHAMDHAWSKGFKRSFSGKSRIVMIAVVIALVPLTIVTAGQALVYAAFIYVVVLSFWVAQYKNKVWSEFAAANGWPIDTMTSQAVLVPLSLQYGHSPRFSPVIQAQLGTTAADLFTYDCTTGEGKSQQTHRFTVARVAVSAVLPHMLLLSKKAHADVRQDLQNHEKLQLEGNFSDYFTFQIEKGQEIDALAIISPDVMQTLVTYNNAEDIEVAGSSLYFIMGSDKRDYTHVQQLITSVVQLSGQIIQHIQLTTVQVQPPTPQTVVTTPAQAHVAAAPPPMAGPNYPAA